MPSTEEVPYEENDTLQLTGKNNKGSQRNTYVTLINNAYADQTSAQKKAAEVRKAETSGAIKILFLVTNPVIGVCVFVAVCIVGLTWAFACLLRWVA